MGLRVQPRIDVVQKLQEVSDRLFEQTRAMRVNVRIRTTSNLDYPVLAETLAPGAFSLTGGMSLLGFQGGDIHNAPTVRQMRRTGEPIVQRDTRVDPPLVPIARDFGGQAGQVLCPVTHDGEFSGFVAVHGDGEPREWSDADVSAVKAACAEIEAILNDAPWFDVEPQQSKLKHLLAVLSDPVEGKEAEYNHWYSGQHLAETLATPGWAAAQRFVLADTQISGHLPQQQYLALYEIEADELQQAVDALSARKHEIASSDAISPEDVVALYTPISERISES
jgi:glutathione S-transferase